jgi:hypothetical protein
MPEYRDPGDSLRGDKIAVSARNISPITVMKRTSSHKGQFTTLRDNAYCVIEVPLKMVMNKK